MVLQNLTGFLWSFPLKGKSMRQLKAFQCIEEMNQGKMNLFKLILKNEAVCYSSASIGLKDNKLIFYIARFEDESYFMKRYIFNQRNELIFEGCNASAMEYCVLPKIAKIQPLSKLEFVKAIGL